jgi:hypothetical protein
MIDKTQSSDQKLRSMIKIKEKAEQVAKVLKEISEIK